MLHPPREMNQIEQKCCWLNLICLKNLWIVSLEKTHQLKYANKAFVHFRALPLVDVGLVLV